MYLAFYMFICSRKTQRYGMHGDKNKFWVDEDDQGIFRRPRRTGGSGPWSGLWFSMRAQKIPPYINAKSGLVVRAHQLVITINIILIIIKFTIFCVIFWTIYPNILNLCDLNDITMVINLID